MRVLEARARQKKLAPQLVIHRAVIVDVEPTDVQRQLTRKQHLRLHDVAALLMGAPDGADPYEVFEGVHTATMHVQRAVVLVDIQDNPRYRPSPGGTRPGWRDGTRRPDTACRRC